MVSPMKPIPNCQTVPLPNHEVSFRVNGTERTRWHYGSQYSRPFFYPLNGPSGETLTRMGHPGAPDHDHHRSVWFAHYKVLGIDFWGDGRNDAYVRQMDWLAYEDTDEEARMAVNIGWFDGHDPAELLTQQLVVSVRDDGEGGTLLETQSRFTPKADSLEFQKTNFGFFAVRVARSISGFFGGGTLTNSDDKTGEKAIFGKPAKWMDYSGNIRVGDKTVVEGVSYLDHPTNPGQPTGWHVREDGWMGASPCMNASLLTTREKPLQVRYLLHAHAGGANIDRINKLLAEFSKLGAFEVKKGRGHVRNVIERNEA